MESTAGKKLDAMVDARRNVVVWERKDDPEWRMDRNAELWTLAGSAWNAGMDWLGGQAVTELGKKVRLDENE